MAAARRSAPFSVLNRSVDMDELTGEPGPEWTRLKCASKKAYGCGEHGQAVVEGLTLCLRLGEDPVLTSSLAIQMSDEARRSIEAELELGAPRKDRWPPREMSAWGVIQIADQHLIVIVLVFQRLYRRDLLYYLVYDGIDASLSMIKYLPDHHEAACTITPVPERTADGRDYDLVIMARELRAPRSLQDVLCVCTPVTRANAASDGTGPWQIMRRRFPGRIRDPFSVDVAFSFQGKAFWADLSEGLAYCDLRSSRSVVDFVFIELPGECQLDLEAMPNEPKKMTRTMGWVGDSIRFVCIDRSRASANDLVTMWTLDLAEGQWKKEDKLSAKVLWAMDGFKEAGLPKALPEYPILTADGALCVVLPDQREFNEDGPVEDCICGVDVRRKRLLWHGRVHNYHTTEPVLLPSSFVHGQHVPCKRKWTEYLPAAELKLAGSQKCIHQE